jgi:hypothetical protein
VNCQYKNSAYLEVVSQPSVIPPGQQTEVDILFYPRECKHYHEVIPFEINGLSVISVDILGQGTEIKVIVRFLSSLLRGKITVRVKLQLMRRCFVVPRLVRDSNTKTRIHPSRKTTIVNSKTRLNRLAFFVQPKFMRTQTGCDSVTRRVFSVVFT